MMESLRGTMRARVAACLLPSMLMTACAHSPDGTAAESSRIPDWLRARIAGYERQPARLAPSTIWRITHQGKPAFYLVSPCCDQFNPLLDAGGREICSPSGGFTGAGDGKCPRPMDEGTQATRIWAHPEQQDPPTVAPGLGVP